MKKALVAIAALLVSISAYAQGQIDFNTHATGVDARVFNSDGITPVIDGFGQLLIQTGTGANATYSALTPVGAFRITTAGAGYINAGAATASVGAGTYNLVLRAWKGAAGSTFENSLATGQSAPFSATLTEAPNIPNELVGLTGFTLVTTPEPTTLALGALGLGALLIRRRK